MERSITWFFLVYCCCCCCCCLASLSTDQSALLALKACITSDPQNMISTNWSTTTPVCNWVGVTCAARHLRVAVLNISYFGLAGTIPPELGNLSFLVDLQLTNNSFSGTLPVELARLRRLKLVSFGYNNFKGEIPSWFGSLPKLATIHLSGNQFTGSIPPAIFNISTLQVINMSKNKLSGSIPRAIRNLTMLKDLYLSYNNFEEFPTDIGTFDQLEILDLQFNSLKGHVPLSVFNMSSLITLSLSRNSLGGNLPDNICQHLPFIQGLYFDENQFDGALPSQLWQCKWLLVLLLFRNNFSGTIPRNIGNLTHLQDLALSDNKLTGTIPDEIGYLQNLKLEKASKSFDIECEMLSNVRHRNLIKIISSCNQSQFKALVLDYMPNGSLERLLYYEEYCSLNILERLNIMIDVASALEYLHHGYSVPIVHCDLKPSNILLDDDMVAHVADFGITKLLGGGDSMTETMTLATVGYMAPEYGMEGIVSRRGDVYSFGIVLMESFTKKKPTDEMFVGEMSLKRWVADSLLSDAIVRVVDANLLGKEEDHDFLNKRDCLSSIMRLALDCSAESANERISMQDAAITLHKIKNNFLKNIAAV
ncbi:hypothetical protein M0R45_005300 [Rubus argutus]|uniref:non-specific serine/threonine protein kinase n=1 Tax=Rubus argutus TaxID=59490 RepID=A0AAW1YMA0_RUBAR